MVTREQIDAALGEDRQAFKTKDIDHDMRALTLLRDRIPYESCKSIIGGAEHDKLFLCDIDKTIDFLQLEDLEILGDCNVCIDQELDCLFLFV